MRNVVKIFADDGTIGDQLWSKLANRYPSICKERVTHSAWFNATDPAVVGFFAEIERAEIPITKFGNLKKPPKYVTVTCQRSYDQDDCEKSTVFAYSNDCLT